MQGENAEALIRTLAARFAVVGEGRCLWHLVQRREFGLWFSLVKSSAAHREKKKEAPRSFRGRIRL